MLDLTSPLCGHELLTVAEMGEADRLTIAGGRPGTVLMERAGHAVADGAAALAPQGRVLVLCGPGNNGGDGFVAARILERRGHAVRVHLLGSVDALKGDALWAAQSWSDNGTRPIHALAFDTLPDADVVIDALFGAGLSRSIEGRARDVIEEINARQVPVLSVDVPSGVHGDTGQVMGAAMRAARTVTFFRLKPGHLLEPGAGLCGEITCADIGIEPGVLDVIAPKARHNHPDIWGDRLPHLGAGSHKYTRGHLVCVSGGVAATGAARLAARGGLRVGAGLVTVASPPDALLVNAAQLTAVMVRKFDGADGLSEILSDKRKNAVVIGPGCGVGTDTVALVEAVLAAGQAAVLDADALTSFRDEPARLFRALHENAVLTPHEGEFNRLFPGLLDRTSDKLSAARAAAKESGAIVLFKGPDTVVAAPDARAAINANAPPTLATAGSGDVLAGFIGGLLAQGMPAFEAACAGAWLHGRCANAFGPGLIAEDLPEMLPSILGSL